MLLDELRGIAARLGVQDVGDVALLPEFDCLGLVGRDMGIAHLGEDVAQLLRLGMGELDELEAVGAGGVLVGDPGFRGVVRETVPCLSPPKVRLP